MATESFVWGAGGAKLTPEQIAIAKQLLARKKMQGADTSPVQHWSQGAARVADALSDVVQERRLNSQESENNTYNSGLISSLLGSSGPAPVTPGATGSAMPKVDEGGNIPVATAPDDVKSLILANVPPEMQGYATNLIGKESSFNPNAVSPTGATGLAQFTRGTGSQYGLVSDQGDLRKDPVANLKALVALTNDNRAGLTKALGRAPTDGELALAHQQGLQGAVNLLSGKSVPGNNLAVNNVDPNSDPRAAANKIMAYYGGSGGQQAAPPMPGEVASLDQSIGIPMPGAEGQMRASAPAQPMPPQAAPQAALPALPASTVGPSPAVASVPPVGVPTSDIPPEFQGSRQLMNADPKQGILAAILGGTPASPQQVAQAQAIGSQQQVAPPQGMGNEAIVRALTSPQANEGTRRIAGLLLQQQQARQQAILENQLKQSDPAYRLGLQKTQAELDQLQNPRISPTDQANIDLNREEFKFKKDQAGVTPDINEYNFYAKKEADAGRAPLGPLEWDMARRKSSASNTTINNGEGNKFYNTLDENNAKIFSGLSDAGIQGRSKLGQIDQLEGLLQSTGSGWATALKAKAGDYGINTEKLDDIQAASAMLSKMIPEQRAPGSGPVSDADLEGFRNSLPRLINQPGGNATIINTMRGLTQYQVKMGEIADRVANREITPAEGRTLIADLPNPLSNFKAPPPGKEDEGWQELSPGVRVRKVK